MVLSQATSLDQAGGLLFTCPCFLSDPTGGFHQLVLRRNLSRPDPPVSGTGEDTYGSRSRFSGFSFSGTSFADLTVSPSCHPGCCDFTIEKGEIRWKGNASLPVPGDLPMAELGG